MKIVIIGGYLNHHSIPLYDELYKKMGKDFIHISTKKIPKTRLNLGYSDVSQLYDYNINAYESKENEDLALSLSQEADILIIGAAPDKYIKQRLKENKVTIRWSERLFKEGMWKIIHPKIAYRLIQKHIKYKNNNLYMFCISAYLPWDLKRISSYKNKMYKWGYFPKTKLYTYNEFLNNKSNEVKRILWVGRMINWKHPEVPIYIAKRLKDEGYNFKLELIGNGKKEKYIKDLIEKYKLKDYVDILGAKSPDEVRTYMERANIYLFTSNFREGWGAVLNEAMNSGCAVVANHAIGSVPFLIKHKENGLVYKNRDINDAYEKVKYLLDNDLECQNISQKAMETIVNEWNAENASVKLIEICKNLLDKNITYYANGIGSKAEVIKNNDYSSVAKES